MALTDAQRAYALIRERLITTEMRPGAVIEETALQAEFGLGRTPIREALKQLEAERLVVVSPRRGMYVSEVTLADLRHIEEVRLALDTLCARLAVERIEPYQLETLRELAAEVEEGASKCTPREALALDRKFHALLRAASHNPILADECEALFDLSQRTWYLLIDRLLPADLCGSTFREMLEAAEQDDPDGAEAAMERHIRQMGAAIKRII
jgi:DNA-binding GntR family transcriptional regulator